MARRYIAWFGEPGFSRVLRSSAQSEAMGERRKGVERLTAGDGEAGPQSTAFYLAEMIGQLESAAGASLFELLAYLLSLARAEAEDIVRQVSQNGSGSRH